MNDDVNCSDLFGFILHLTALKNYLFIWLHWVFVSACGTLVPQPGIKPSSPALEGRFLTTGPTRKSLTASLFSSSHKTNICSLYKIFKIQEIKITLLST